MRILLHFDAGRYMRERIEATRPQGWHIDVCPEHDEARFAALIPEADVLWHSLKPVTADVLRAAPRLRLVQKLGVGLDAIDLEAARRLGIAVCNMPGTNSNAVAEMTLLLMLSTLRALPVLDRATRAGTGWDTGPQLQDRLGELAGASVGLIGFGAVPRLLLPMLRAIGARVSYHARRADPAWPDGQRTLQNLLAESDIVSLHLPLTESTTGLIDANALALMKPGAILINTARGALVDEAALVQALRSGHLLGAGLDVFRDEPLPSGHALASLDNVVLTPHVAWLTRETTDRNLAAALENCRRLADGAALLNRVV